MHSRRRNELGNPDLITQTLAPSFYEIIIFWTIKETSSELQIHIQDLEIKKAIQKEDKNENFRTFSTWRRHGTPIRRFDLWQSSRCFLKGKILFTRITKISKYFRLYQKFMVTKTLTQLLLVTTTFHTSNGAMQTEMDLLHFSNPLDVVQKQDSGTQLKLDGSTGPPTQLPSHWNLPKSWWNTWTTLTVTTQCLSTNPNSHGTTLQWPTPLLKPFSVFLMKTRMANSPVSFDYL